MSRPGEAGPETAGKGETTAAEGTPVPVDVTTAHDRAIWVVLLAGPLIWTAHFLVVYLVTEAGCSGDGPGLSLFDPPVPKVVTLGATAVAAVASLVCAVWTYRRWQAGTLAPTADEAGKPVRGGDRPDTREDIWASDRGGLLAFAGFLLSLLSFVTVLFVGLPAVVLPSC